MTGYNLQINRLGDKRWRYNGLIHRLNGPAIILNHSTFNSYVVKDWWFNDQYIKCSSQEEFDRLIKLRLLW